MVAVPDSPDPVDELVEALLLGLADRYTSYERRQWCVPESITGGDPLARLIELEVTPQRLADELCHAEWEAYRLDRHTQDDEINDYIDELVTDYSNRWHARTARSATTTQ